MQVGRPAASYTKPHRPLMHALLDLDASEFRRRTGGDENGRDCNDPSQDIERCQREQVLVLGCLWEAAGAVPSWHMLRIRKHGGVMWLLLCVGLPKLLCVVPCRR